MKRFLFTVSFGIFSCVADPHATNHSIANPARIERPTSLIGLTSVVLEADAESALGIKVAPAEESRAGAVIQVGGEVMVAAGGDVVLAAPVGGRIGSSTKGFPLPGEKVRAGQLLMTLIPLASIDRDVKAGSERDLEVAKADLTLAETRVSRAEAMVADRSGSQRALDEAIAQKQIAQAAVSAAEARLKTLRKGSLDSDLALSITSPAEGVLRTLHVTPGQSVPSGASLLGISANGRWIKASFPVSDGVRIENIQEVTARRIGATESVPLALIQGPPSADPRAGTIDRFFALPETSNWTPGERVLVEVRTADLTSPAMSVPFSSVIRDAEGGAWVYVQSAPHTFQRRRVEPIQRVGEHLLLAPGLTPGAQIVQIGAAELWGFELGADR